MSFLNDQLPKGLLDAVNAAIAEGGGGGAGGDGTGNTTSSSIRGDPAVNADKVIWDTISSQFPLTSIWPLAILLALISLAILSILLKLTWSLARAKLTFFRTYKIHYSSSTSVYTSASPTIAGYAFEDAFLHSTVGKKRTILLPAEGSVLLCALVSCTAGVVQALGIEGSGRLAWLGVGNVVVRTVEFTSLWMAVLFLLIGSICFLPLFTSRTSPARFLGLSEHTSPHLPKELARPFLHPLLSNCILFLIPISFCLVPNLLAFARSYTSITRFRAGLVKLVKPEGGIEAAIKEIASHNGTIEGREETVKTISNDINDALYDWRLESLVRFLSVASLLLIIIYIEYKAQKRLSITAQYLGDVEEAAVNEFHAAAPQVSVEEKESSIFRLAINDVEQEKYTRTPHTCLVRSPSYHSSSPSSRGVRTPSLYSDGPRRPQSTLARSCIDRSYTPTGYLRPSSRASSYRSFSASLAKEPAVLYVPEMPELDLKMPSPSLLRDELGAATRSEADSPYSPALKLFGDRLDRSNSPSLTGNGSQGSSRRPSLHRERSVLSNSSSLRCSERGYGQTRSFSMETTPRVEYKVPSDDYFGDSDGKLPYDDGYEAHLEDLEYGSAIAHMLNPYDGVEEGQHPSTIQLPEATKRDPTSGSHLSRSHTPALLDEQRQRTKPSPALSGATSPAWRGYASENRGSRRPQSRASSYSYRTHSSSSSGASSFSYASARTAASWRSKLIRASETYQGPNEVHVQALKKSRAIDAALVASFVLFQGLMEVMCAIAAESIMNSKMLQASVSFASMLLKTLPILGGVMLCSMRSSQPAYGWLTRHIIVSPGDERACVDDGVSVYEQRCSQSMETVRR